MADRYHRAAQDGFLDVLKETTKKDTNAKDEDGMTPTLWAAFEGNLDALRLLIGRGGDPEKCDHYGNTALHLAAAKGHMTCVSFLVNFGVSVFCQDIDQHTPQELAAMNDCQEILRYLDAVTAKQNTEDPKKVKRQQEQAEKDVAKLVKNFRKVQRKADKLSSRKEKALESEIEKMQIKTPTTVTLARRDSAIPSSNSSSNLNFSDMVGQQHVGGGGGGDGSGSGGGTTNSNKSKSGVIGTVFKKAGRHQRGHVTQPDNTFKVRATEVDGVKTVKSISGLLRDSEIMFVAPDKHDAAADQMDSRASAAAAAAAMQQGRRDTFGIFDRPGFGSTVFRRDSMAATLFAVQHSADGGEDSIGSTGDLASPSRSVGGEDEDGDGAGGGGGDSDREDAAVGVPTGAIDMFLAGLGLQQYAKVFRKEKIDLETLMLLDEQNLMEMKVEIGPRKKILKAIDERKRAMEDDGPIEDSRM